MESNAWARRAASALWAWILGIAIVIAAWILGGSAVNIANSRATITVTGSAKRQIRSDMVVWRGTYSAQSPEIESAYTQLKGDMGRVKSYLVAKGIPEDSLVFTAIATRIFRTMGPRGEETGAITGYLLSQTVEVRSREVERIGTVAREATELIHQGIRMESQPPEYLYTRLSDLKVAMLADATRDARARAEELAKNAGSKIGRLRTARMGVFQITPAFSTMVADYGINDTSSLLKDITSVVSVSFEIR